MEADHGDWFAIDRGQLKYGATVYYFCKRFDCGGEPNDATLRFLGLPETEQKKLRKEIGPTSLRDLK